MEGLEGQFYASASVNNSLGCVCVVCVLLKKGFSSQNFQEKSDIKFGRSTVPVNLETRVNKSVKKFIRHYHVRFQDNVFPTLYWIESNPKLKNTFCINCPRQNNRHYEFKSVVHFLNYVLDDIPHERFLGSFVIVASLEYESKLVAQNYDSAAVMADHLGGLQAKVKKNMNMPLSCIVLDFI
nr:unnamed protein product [Callosobruchus analis]